MITNETKAISICLNSKSVNNKINKSSEGHNCNRPQVADKKLQDKAFSHYCLRKQTVKWCTAWWSPAHYLKMAENNTCSLRCSVLVVAFISILIYFALRPVTFVIETDIFIHRPPEAVYKGLSDLKNSITYHKHR